MGRISSGLKASLHVGIGWQMLPGAAAYTRRLGPQRSARRRRCESARERSAVGFARSTASKPARLLEIRRRHEQVEELSDPRPREPHPARHGGAVGDEAPVEAPLQLVREGEHVGELRGKRIWFSFIDAEKACLPVAVLCATLKVSHRSQYAWSTRPEANVVAREFTVEPGWLYAIGYVSPIEHELRLTLEIRAARHDGSRIGGASGVARSWPRRRLRVRTQSEGVKAKRVVPSLQIASNGAFAAPASRDLSGESQCRAPKLRL